MDRRIGRRGFLKALAAGLAAGSGVAGALVATVPGGGGRSADCRGGVPAVRSRIAAPGDVAVASWPVGLDPRRARFVHRLDGREIASARVGRPGSGPDAAVEMVAECGGLQAGVHRFELETTAGVADLGGFEVRRFSFGC